MELEPENASRTASLAALDELRTNSAAQESAQAANANRFAQLHRAKDAAVQDSAAKTSVTSDFQSPIESLRVTVNDKNAFILSQR